MNGVAVAVRTHPAFLSVALGLAAAAGAYAPVVVGMAGDWAQFPSLSHGFAIPLIAAYLVWSRRDRLAVEEPRPSLFGLPLVLAGLALLVVGSLGGEPFVARVSLPLTLLGTVLFLGGPAVTRHAWVGIAYLSFMIPLPYMALKSLTYQSRLFDARITAEALQLLGVPVLRDGVFLHLANVILEVADDCSSVPAIAALVALGAAYGQLNPRGTWIRVILTVAAAPLGLLSNIFRLIVTALGAYYVGPIALNNVVHKFNGTSVFLLTVLLLVVLDGLLGRVFRAKAT